MEYEINWLNTRKIKYKKQLQIVKLLMNDTTGIPITDKQQEGK